MQRPCRFACLLVFAAGCSDGVDTGALTTSDAALDTSIEALDSGAAADSPTADSPTADRPDSGSVAQDVAPVATSDVPSVDRPSQPDASTADVGTTDGPAADAGPSDTGAGCTGAAPTVSVTAPTQDEMIETCSASEAAVYYDFTASVAPGSSVQQVSARWITPEGAAAPPPATLSAAPFTFRRQVGGPTTGAPPLAVFGIRGGWRFEVTATDRCGRSTTATRSFSLVFTSRRCPNP